MKTFAVALLLLVVYRNADAAAPETTKIIIEHSVGVSLSPNVIPDLKAEVIQDYSAFTLVRIPTARLEKLEDRARRLGISVQLVDRWDELRMPNYTMDARRPVFPWTGDRPRFASGAGLFVVQFVGPTLPKWLADVRATGLLPVSYLPHNAVLLAGTEVAFEQVRKMPVVQLSAPYVPAFKAQPRSFAGETKNYTVQLVNVPAAAATITRLTTIVQRDVQYRVYRNFDVRLDGLSARELLQDPFVVAVEERGVWMRSGEREALSVQGTFTPPQPNSYRSWLSTVPFLSDYRAQRIAVADTGFCGGAGGGIHPDFRGNVYFGPSYIPGDNGYDFDGHGTAVAGMAVGDPNPAAVDRRDPAAVERTA